MILSKVNLFNFFNKNFLDMQFNINSQRSSFISSFIENAQFSEEERSSNYKIIINGEIYISDDSTESTSARLGKLLEFFNSCLTRSKNTSQNSLELIADSLVELSENFFWNFKTRHQKKTLARELVFICSRIYERKEEVDFLEIIEKFNVKKLEISKLNLEFMILNYIYLASKKTNEELIYLVEQIKMANQKQITSVIDESKESLPLDSERPQQSLDLSPLNEVNKLPNDLLFDYIVKHVIYDYILDMALLYIEDCRRESSDITLENIDEKKIILTFFYNYYQNCGSKLYLKPYFIELLGGVDKADIGKVPNKLLNIIFSTDSKNAICNFLASQIVKKLDKSSESSIVEIVNLDFIRKLNSKISEISSSYIDFLKEEDLEDDLKHNITEQISIFREKLLTNLFARELLKIRKNQKPIQEYDEDSQELQEIVNEFKKFYQETLFKKGVFLTADKIKIFKTEIDNWIKFKLSENEDNHYNIIEAGIRIIECYRNQSKSLDISNLQLKSITPIIFSLDHLENLNITGNALKEIDVDEIFKLKNLKTINISSNKLQVRPEFLNENLVVEDRKNPYLLSLLISIAEFSEEEYSRNYKILLSRNYANFVSDTSIILEDFPKNSELIQEYNLSDWLEIMKDYYSGVKVDESNIKEILMIEKINQIIDRITSIIEKKPDEILVTNQKIIARELMSICSKLYEQKVIPKFLDAVNKIISIEDQNYDQRLRLKIACLYNLCFTKTLEELESDISSIDDYSAKEESFDISRIDKNDQTFEIEKFQTENFVFSYLKNKLLFDYIFDLVQKNSQQISILEVISNDDELFINYLSIINERFSSQLELTFPVILYPRHIENKTDKYPSENDVKELAEISKAKIDCVNFMPLCYLMAKQVVKKISETEDSFGIFEISNLQFIKQLKEQINKITEKKIIEIAEKTKPDSNLFKKNHKEIIEQSKHELTNLITKQFFEISQNQKPSANISHEHSENILKNFDRLYKQYLFEEKKLGLTMDISSRVNPDSSNRPYPSSPASSCSKCLSVILPFQMPKKTKGTRCKSANYQPSI